MFTMFMKLGHQPVAVTNRCIDISLKTTNMKVTVVLDKESGDNVLSQ